MIRLNSERKECEVEGSRNYARARAIIDDGPFEVTGKDGKVDCRRAWFMLTVLSLRSCSGRAAFSRHARSTLSSVAKVRNRVGPMAAVIRSVTSRASWLVEMKDRLGQWSMVSQELLFTA
jgi:hypothetical protein